MRTAAPVPSSLRHEPARRRDCQAHTTQVVNNCLTTWDTIALEVQDRLSLPGRSGKQPLPYGIRWNDEEVGVREIAATSRGPSRRSRQWMGARCLHRKVHTIRAGKQHCVLLNRKDAAARRPLVWQNKGDAGTTQRHALDHPLILSRPASPAGAKAARADTRTRASRRLSHLPTTRESWEPVVR